MVNFTSPDCLILSESMIREVALCKRLRLIHFYHYVYVPPNSHSGGLCVAWKNEVDLEPQFVSKNVICGTVFFDPPNCLWSFIAIYGLPGPLEWKIFWESLSFLLDRSPGARVIIGDLNGTLLDSESWSSSRGSRGSSSSLLALYECCSNLGLTDLGFQGPKFTWGRRRGGFLFQRSRLDRVFASIEWRTLFPKATVHVLPYIASDHNAIQFNILVIRRRRNFIDYVKEDNGT
ncbi:Endonuclease/exonuclease/phosphatase [Trema orientale]|uniref:Endonuclease/exonuclease/phosphatase n=1 Tax=Trema orientale TaxID=63057 RepID=A0A2P5FXT5_TREOI|nr:Endonuclease/exonuclease/phosphatase [Trema orientale]